MNTSSRQTNTPALPELHCRIHPGPGQRNPIANTAEKTRSKITLACSACRLRKTRCSGSTPCTVCQSRQTLCLYDVLSDKRRMPFRNAAQCQLDEMRIELKEDRRLLSGIMSVLQSGEGSEIEGLLAMTREGAGRERVRHYIAWLESGARREGLIEEEPGEVPGVQIDDVAMGEGVASRGRTMSLSNVLISVAEGDPD